MFSCQLEITGACWLLGILGSFAFLRVIEPRLIKIRTGSDVKGMSILQENEIIFFFLSSNATFFTASPHHQYLCVGGLGAIEGIYSRGALTAPCSNERNDMIARAGRLVAWIYELLEDSWRCSLPHHLHLILAPKLIRSM